MTTLSPRVAEEYSGPRVEKNGERWKVFSAEGDFDGHLPVELNDLTEEQALAVRRLVYENYDAGWLGGRKFHRKHGNARYPLGPI